jgi:hypothetical protein
MGYHQSSKVERILPDKPVSFSGFSVNFHEEWINKINAYTQSNWHCDFKHEEEVRILAGR